MRAIVVLECTIQNYLIMKKSLFTFCLLFLSVSLFAAPLQPCTTCGLETFEQMLSLSPILFFILILIVIFWKLNKDGYQIGDALKENITIEVSEENPVITEKPKPATDGTPNQMPIAGLADTTTNTPPPFVPRTIQPKSTSRLIAFISGLVSVGLASCLCSFWFYNHLIHPDTKLVFTELVNVLLALGIGVIPYAVNKITTGK
jgi:hypothetical protein